MSGNWIAGAVKHKGALHRELHVPQGEKIPHSKIVKAAHSNNPTLAKRARLAETLGKLRKRHGGAVEHPERVERHVEGHEPHHRLDRKK